MALTDERPTGKVLDPELRERLIRESQTPWRGLRRALWFALFASAGLGLFTMLFRLSAGSAVELGDVGIQGGALVLFASLLWFDRSRSRD
ncbi:MAG: DUF3493 domain-containing protein [Parasynechococcus sp.]|uniref:DUF3493 domain-containing protein n=1 Tax=Synechococcales TaxID=1890424 RepID=UPI0012EC4EC1|nr:DUF3493 domain-containing protein [Synechococcus sp. KORDI-49]